MPVELEVNLSVSIRDGSDAGQSSSPVLRDDAIADRLGIHVDIVRGLIRSGALKGHRWGHGFAATKAAVARYEQMVKGLPPDQHPDALLNATESARYLNVDRGTVFNYRKTGKLKAKSDGPVVRIFLSELRRFVAESTRRGFVE